jgi:hypothetical protein
MNFMPENKDNTTNQSQLETLKQLSGNLTGLNKWVAQRVLSSDFIEKIKKVAKGTGTGEINSAVRNLIDTAVLQAANVVLRKFALILIGIVGVFTLLVAIVMFFAGGNILIPIIAFVVLFAITWFVTGLIAKLIARGVSGAVFKVVEGSIAKLTG